MKDKQVFHKDKKTFKYKVKDVLPIISKWSEPDCYRKAIKYVEECDKKGKMPFISRFFEKYDLYIGEILNTAKYKRASSQIESKENWKYGDIGIKWEKEMDKIYLIKNIIDDRGKELVIERALSKKYSGKFSESFLQNCYDWKSGNDKTVPNQNIQILLQSFPQNKKSLPAKNKTKNIENNVVQIKQEKFEQETSEVDYADFINVEFEDNIDIVFDNVQKEIND